jgi:putative tricarboxylic transport membrane protein
MHEKDSAAAEGPALVSNKAMEIVVALLLLGGSAIVISDTIRIGFGWQEGLGPAPGYFPFWIAVILGFSSLINLVATVVRPGEAETFVSVRSFGRVLAVLVPSFVYAALIGGVSLGSLNVAGIGIYIASLIFIFAFMLVLGRESPARAVGVAVVVAVLLFVMFEKLFLVPLPRCLNTLCSGIEETLIGVPYDWLRSKVLEIGRLLNLV